MFYLFRIGQTILILALISMPFLFFWTMLEGLWLSAGMSVFVFVLLLQSFRRVVPLTTQNPHPTLNYTLFWTVMALTVIFCIAAIRTV